MTATLPPEGAPGPGSDLSAASIDTRVWRAKGDPLVEASGPGPLQGHSVAVKDVFAVRGYAIGAGNPSWLGQAPIQTEHAWAVQALLDAGADVGGIAHCDEFAYSLAGTNPHLQTPPNPAAPGRIPGGSSSGSATAVALGQASIGLGTDTAGSIRVPAAYQGLFGMRPSLPGICTDGLLPLAPSFDAVGWITRDVELLRLVGDCLLPPAPPRSLGDLVIVPELLALAEPAVQAAIRRVGPIAERARSESWELGADWPETFRVQQAAEAWRQHGPWLADRLDSLGADVRGRFITAAALTEDQIAEAAHSAPVAREAVRAAIGDRVVVIPSAPTVAPLLGADLAAARAATLQLTSLASLGGLAAVTIPLLTVDGRTADGLPCGLGLLAGPGRDRDLLDFAVELSREMSDHHPGSPQAAEERI